MTRSSALLLLDLDGVCALEKASPDGPALELFKLHQDLGAGIAALGFPVVVITHRSRKEALRILSAIGVDRGQMEGIFTAENFLFASLGKPLDLFRHGLLKSAALRAIERKFQVSRGNMAIIDDRDDVLHDLKTNGVGLCMKAPSQNSGQSDDLVSFEFSEAAQVFAEWREQDSAWAEIRPLTPYRLQVAQGWRTGKNTHLSKFTVFNMVRVVARYARAMRRAAS
jgi:hypothetical protein